MVRESNVRIAVLEDRLQSLENWKQSTIGRVKPDTGKLGNRGAFITEMEARFDLEDLMAITFVLNLEWHNLKGDKKVTKIISLIEECEKLNIKYKLVQELQRRRPQVSWPEI